MRGGVSGSVSRQYGEASFSPRAWRCFHEKTHWRWFDPVFSTCVEVFLVREAHDILVQCFLHVRGGVSEREGGTVSVFMFSPRAWRCFSNGKTSIKEKSVFSTCVEVFLKDDLR